MGVDDGEMQDLEVISCSRCPQLVESRSRIVNGVGPTDAELLIVGEAPGAQEDSDGEPFVGRSGQLLTEKLAAVGIDRSRVRITNCVRCRPPDNRDPRTTELANCRTWLHREIELVDPLVVLAVGKVPAEHLLERSVAVTTEAGTVDEITVGETVKRVIVCVHPAAMLYDPGQEETLDDTLAVAAKQLGISPPPDPQVGLEEFQ